MSAGRGTPRRSTQPGYVPANPSGASGGTVLVPNGWQETIQVASGLSLPLAGAWTAAIPVAPTNKPAQRLCLYLEYTQATPGGAPKARILVNNGFGIATAYDANALVAGMVESRRGPLVLLAVPNNPNKLAFNVELPVGTSTLTVEFAEWGTVGTPGMINNASVVLEG